MLRTLAALALLTAATSTHADFFSERIEGLTLETDLTKLNGQPVSSKEKEKGQLTFSSGGKTFTVNVKVNLRGQSSRTDCTFKKLGVTFKDKDVAGTPLEGLSKLQLNTHCAENTARGFTSNGRIAGDRGPVREGMVYTLLHTLGIMGARHQVAPITYIDTTAATKSQHQVLILEAKGDLARRSNAKILEEEDVQDQEALLDAVSRTGKNAMTATGLLFEAMIGNFDHTLQLRDNRGERHYNPVAPPPGMHNMLIADFGNGGYSALPTDFDMSTLVLQQRLQSIPLAVEFSGCASSICEQQFLMVQKWRAFFAPEVFAAAIGTFVAKEREMKQAVQNSTLNEAERRFVTESLDTFIDVLKNRLNVPTLNESTAIYKDPGLTQKCGHLAAPAGIPLKALERRGDVLRALVLDTRDGALTDPETGESCEGEVWLRVR